MLTFLVIVTIIIAVIAILMAIWGETAKIQAQSMLVVICELIAAIFLLVLYFNSQ